MLLLSSLSFDFRGQTQLKACDKIIETVDQFNGQITEHTPYTTQFGGFVSALKVVDGEDVNYYLSLNSNGQTLNVGEKGVTIICDNGSVMDWPDAKIEVEWKEYGGGYSAWRYSAFIPLNDVEMRILSTTTIKAYRLYIYDTDLSSASKRNIKNKSDFMIQMSCLTGIARSDKNNDGISESGTGDLTNIFNKGEVVLFVFEGDSLEAEIINISGARCRLEYVDWKKNKIKSANVNVDELIKMD